VQEQYYTDAILKSKKQTNTMAPTIKDIAQETGFSYATVSRALNNKYGVKSGTRDRILAVAQARGYTPNALARGLVKKQSQTIGLIIPDISNPFFPQVARGVEDSAQAKGYSVFLCNTNYESAQEARYLKLLVEKRVDGIILTSGFQASAPLDARPTETIPMVSLCTRFDNVRNSFVVIDNERGGFIATKHLIEQGYGTIGFIGNQGGRDDGSQRYQGYRQALDKFNIPFNSDFVFTGDLKRESGYEIIKRIIAEQKSPRAFFIENDLMALGVIQGITESGLKVPDDIAVVGFDDISFAAFPEIGLTTVRQPKYEMGKLAAEILLDCIANGAQEPKRYILEPELVIRTSSGKPLE
jgi:LacI family transcriptional regulator